MLNVHIIKEISNKIHDNTISNWASEIEEKNEKKEFHKFPDKYDFYILFGLLIVILLLGILTQV